MAAAFLIGKCNWFDAAGFNTPPFPSLGGVPEGQGGPTAKNASTPSTPVIASTYHSVREVLSALITTPALRATPPEEGNFKGQEQARAYSLSLGSATGRAYSLSLGSATGRAYSLCSALRAAEAYSLSLGSATGRAYSAWLGFTEPVGVPAWLMTLAAVPIDRFALPTT